MSNALFDRDIPPQPSFSCVASTHPPLVPRHLWYSPSFWFSSFCVASSFCLVQQPNSLNQPTPRCQKAPGQDLAQTARFPMIPEGAFNCRLASRQSSKIWLQKAPGQDLAQNGRFPMIPEETLLIAGPKALQWQKFVSKRLLARIWPKRAVSQ